MDSLVHASAALQLGLRYSSVFDECWQLTRARLGDVNSGDDVTPVAHCPKAPGGKI